jgi:AraC family transcriptional regulator, regulatory protein of adaptative response / DNA-3-methyladenine glycosylase II
VSADDERSTGLQRAPSGGPAGSALIPIKLAYRRPLQLADLLEFLGRRAVSGVEHYSAGRYRRIVPLRHGHAVVELLNAGDHLACRLELQDRRDLATAEFRCRRLLDLDADWEAIEAVLATDPALRVALAEKPGLRIPGTLDVDELAIRAVLGQQVSLDAARTIAGRLVAAYGEPLQASDGALTHLWPRSSVLANTDLAVLGMPNSRREALRGLARVLADGLLQDGEAEPSEVRGHLLALPGIGPWTTSYIEMRALSNADAFLSSDLGVRKGAEILGLPVAPHELKRHAERWRPWRAYAVQYLWAAAGTSRSPKLRP